MTLRRLKTSVAAVLLACGLAAPTLGTAAAGVPAPDAPPLLPPPPAAADSSLDDTITVVGQRREAERRERPGQSLVIRPEDATRFDTAAQLRRDVSLTVPETGRITAAGFGVPRVRGQDARLTEVYVEDLLLQDPYSGLPLVDELDLRAFGELAMHVGVPPPELPTVGPVGVLQYRLRPVTKAAASAGATLGRPYGAAIWALDAQPLGGGEGRLYLRRHESDGIYPYYDDNGTPYNSADDSIRPRLGNYRRSTQAMPVVRTPLGSGTLTALGILQRSESGLPSLIAGRDMHAATRADTWLATSRWETPRGLALTLAANEDHRTTSDPEHQVLGPRGSADLAVKGAKAGAEVRLGPEAATTRLGVEASAADVRASSTAGDATHVTRTAMCGYGSAALQPTPAATIEAKILGRAFDDRAASGGAGDSQTAGAAPARTTTDGETLAASWTIGALTPYAQLGRVKRAPTLLEEFGDGALIRANADLTPEAGVHEEIGVFWRSSSDFGHASCAAFEDDTHNRIVLLPSLAQTLRAQNVGFARIRGVEVRGDWRLGRTQVSAGASRLYPEDLTDPAHPRMLPLVADRQLVTALDERLGALTLRWDSRYQSQLYRDLADTVAVPAYWIHDAAADVTATIAGRKVASGLAILNVANVRSLPVQAEGPNGSSGTTAYSDVSGYPLPGRQWRASVAVTF